MGKVIFIGEGPTGEKPVEFTHRSNGTTGWVKLSTTPIIRGQVIYLGACDYDGDMFAVKWDSGSIDIYKGHLNSGNF